MDYQPLYQKLDYQFKDPGLLETALTHRSASKQNNERLEYLGDSILNFAIAEALFSKFPDISEGKLSRMRANLVKKDTLATVAKKLTLSDYIHLGGGEFKSGGFRRKSILADALEAIIAAIYIDSDMTTCKSKILLWFTNLLANISPESEQKDPKTQLQEYLQARHVPLPIYKIISTHGKKHEQTFVVSCSLQHQEITITGQGESRRRAEQDAASQMLLELHNE